jgi:hypothetical protein
MPEPIDLCSKGNEVAAASRKVAEVKGVVEEGDGSPGRRTRLPQRRWKVGEDRCCCWEVSCFDSLLCEKG